MDIRASDIDLQMSPELISASLKKKEADVYFFWLLMKAIDQKIGNSSGHFLMNEMLSILKKIYQ